jgi:hypothetical protein
MKKIIMLGLIWLLLGSVIHGQNSPSAKSAAAPVSSTSSSITVTPESTPVELARAALAAQGGEKFKHLENMTLSGTVNIYPASSPQSIPGKFLWITAGECLRIELNAQPLVFKQIFDGQRSYSSIPGLQLGAPKLFGLALLRKFDQPGYTVSALPNRKKLRGFSIGDAEGHVTEFYIDPATGRVMIYRIANKQYTFATEHTKLQEVDGVLVPYNFTQKLEMPQGTFYLEFKVKDARVNQLLGDDVFAIP